MRYFITKKRNRVKNISKGFWPTFLIVGFLSLFISPVYANPLQNDSLENSDVSSNEEAFTSRTVFIRYEGSALEILPRSIRLDMLDYWDVDSVYKAVNVVGGLSYLENVSDNYLKVRISPVSSLEIKILPTKKEKIAMTIYTVGDDPQAADSELKFYDESLNELETKKYFEAPQVKNFFDIPKGSVTSMKEIEQMIPFPTIAYTASPDNNNLEARLTVEKFINQDDWNIAKLFVKPSITLEWKKDKFKY